MKTTQALIACIIIVIMLFRPLTGGERRGAEIIVSGKDGTAVRGELISVKQKSLVVFTADSLSAPIQSIPAGEIREVKIIKKSKVGKGMFWGALIGAGIGAIKGSTEGESWISFWQPHDTRVSPEFKAVVHGLALGTSGWLIGGIIGAVSGIDRILPFEHKPEKEINSSLQKLSNFARMKGIQ